MPNKIHNISYYVDETGQFNATNHWAVDHLLVSSLSPGILFMLFKLFRSLILVFLGLTA